MFYSLMVGHTFRSLKIHHLLALRLSYYFLHTSHQSEILHSLIFDICVRNAYRKKTRTLPVEGVSTIPYRRKSEFHFHDIQRLQMFCVNFVNFNSSSGNYFPLKFFFSYLFSDFSLHNKNLDVFSLLLNVSLCHVVMVTEECIPDNQHFMRHR